AWQLLAEKFQEVIQADRIAFLLVLVGEVEELKLFAYPPQGNELQLEPEHSQQLLDYLRRQNRSLWSHTYDTPGQAEKIEAIVEEKLFRGAAFSTLWALLKDRRGFLLGTVIAARLVNPEGNKSAPFGLVEEQ